MILFVLVILTCFVVGLGLITLTVGGEKPVSLYVAFLTLLLVTVFMWFFYACEKTKVEKEYYSLQQELREFAHAMEKDTLSPKELESMHNNIIKRYIVFISKACLFFTNSENYTIDIPSITMPWQCNCGAENKTDFCPKCGSKKPALWECCKCNTKTRAAYCDGCGQSQP